MKKQHLGILRNKTDRLTTIKREMQRKKNRFQMVGKELDQDVNTFTLTTTNSEPRSNSEFTEQDNLEESAKAIKLFEQAREKMKKVFQIQKKMAEMSKARLSCLREKDNQKYDVNISKMAGEATQLLLGSENVLKQINKLQADSPIQSKVLKSVSASLASQIQQASRSLRQQQQQYFKRVKSYEGSTTNSAIQLTAEQRKAMQGQWQILQTEQKQQNKGQVNELVNSITRLSALYKQLSQLVVAQGTVIDRIDYNIQAAEQHINKAVVHLTAADTAASSAFADKVIKILALAVILMAIILGLKYMN